MNLTEIGLRLDVAAHFLIGFFLLLIVVRLPHEQLASRYVKLAIAILSLMLGVACMQYSKLVAYKILHGMWELSLALNFAVVAHTVYKSK